MLDSDVCVEVIRGRGGPLQAYADRRLLVSTVTEYELRVGAEKSRRSEAKERTGRFLERVEILDFDRAAADRAAVVRAALEKGGKAIGPYDYLIAGHALSATCALLTANVQEFARVPHLEVLQWGLM